MKFNAILQIVIGFCIAAPAFGQVPVVSAKNAIDIDLSKPGAKVQPSMYGIFFEEINHSGDGGLYAELIQNRGFEDKNLPGGTRLDSGFAIAPSKPNYRNNQNRNFRLPWNMQNMWPGWSVRKDATKAELSLTTEQPLNSATPHSLQMKITSASRADPLELANEGYWGVGLKQGEKYNARFHLRTNASYKGMVTAKLISADGKILGQSSLSLKATSGWNEYKTSLISTGTDGKAAFVLSFDAPGMVWVDYVSLFPDKTFKNRNNGLRTDVAQLLAEMKPAFIRWPGGCIVEGLTLENRVKWKETIGDPVIRPGEYDLWGYRNTYGFGYHEFLQFSEDIGSAGMFVANMGLSCSVRNGDYCTVEELGEFVQEALDAIEYAIGDVNTKWGAKRAAAGHPKPFPLKYVEVGNENAGVEIYNERYNIFHKAISARYPKIEIISNHGLNDNLASVQELDMIDPHYYVAPDWFYARANTIFDNIQPRPKHTAYVGEYAVNRNVGTGNMNAALSEAAFLVGAERNSDFVKLMSYAPLIENSNKRDWQVNLIWLKSDQSMGRSSYYVQKLFANNRPDINLPVTLKEKMNISSTPFSGNIGLVANRVQVEVKDMNFTGGENTGPVDFNTWKSADGKWVASGNGYTQTDTGGRHLTMLQKNFGNGTLAFNVKRAKRAGNNPQGNRGGGGGGRGGFGNNFAFMFGGTDDKNYYQLSFTPRTVTLEKVVNGTPQYVAEPARLDVEDDRYYSVRVTTLNDNVEVFMDDKPVIKYTFAPDIKHYAIAGLDQAKNEIIVKVVNAEAAPLKTTINLNGATGIHPMGQVITLSANALTDENTFEQPLKISPKAETYQQFSNSFNMEFKPYSLTILRFKKK